MSLHVWFFPVFLLLMHGASLEAASFAVTGVGTLGGAWSSGLGIGSTGVAVGVSALPAGTPWAFAWDGRIMTRLVGPPGAASAQARDANSRGLVAGTAWVRGIPRATLWRNGSSELIGPPGAASYATAVNERGQAAGAFVTPSGEGHAFLYGPDGWVDIGAEWGASWSSAYALNDAGAVAGYGETAPGVFRGFLRSPDGAITLLGTFGGRSSYAFGINSAGDAAGHAGLPGGELHAFLYQDGIMIDLGTLGGGSSFAYGINDAGEVVGSSWTADGRRHAFLYRNGRLLDLNDLILGASQWELTAAFAINARGQIAGAGYWNGRRMAFLLDPLDGAGGPPLTENPEPGTWVMAAAGLGLLALGNRRRRSRQRPRG